MVVGHSVEVVAIRGSTVSVFHTARDNLFLYDNAGPGLSSTVPDMTNQNVKVGVMENV